MSNRTRTTLALIVLALVFTALGIWFGNRADDAREEEMAPAPVAPQTSASKPALASSAENSKRSEVAQTPKTSPASATPAAKPNAAASLHVRGRVVDITGRGVADTEITAYGEPLVVFARSRGDGAFEFDGSLGSASLVANSAAFATVRALPPGYESSRIGLIVVAPIVAVSGVVVDESGNGIAGARVAAVPGHELLAHFPLPTDATTGIAATEVVCDAGGAFSLAQCIVGEGTRLRASSEGLEPADVPAPTTPRSDLRIVLKKHVDSARTLTGFVVRASGAPATNARVYVGEVSAATDARGAFSLDVPKWLPEEQPVVAIESGSQPAVLPDFGKLARDATRRFDPLRLVLGAAPLSISGRVVDAQGKPLENWNVALLHATSVSIGRVPPVTAESLTSGSDAEHTTDAQGAFRIEGLLEREYELCAWNSDTLARIESKPIKAGTRDVVLALEADMLVPHVTGRVIAPDGTPLAGIDVSVGLVTARAQGATSWISGKQTHTGADGKFEFADVPRHFAHLNVGGEQIIPLTFSLDGVDLARPVTIEAARRCHFRVEGLTPSSDPRWITAKDADGQEVQIMVFQAGGWSSSSRQEAPTDATRVFGVSERAIELVLVGVDGRTPEKRALHLVPGDVTVVKW